MVFVWGNKGYQDLLGYIIFECPSCQTTGIFSVEQIRKKFTVYFVPTFSYSQKQYITCTTCQATFEVPKELKPEVVKNLMSQEELSSLIREANKEVSESESSKENLTTKSSGRFCPSCNNKVAKKATFCPNCGAKLDK